LTEKLLDTYKNTLSGVTLAPSQGGAFEVSVNGKLIHSKLAGGQFPDEALLVTKVGALR
jgi:selenoprotein W-related protein